MSVQVSYKKQSIFGVICIIIILLVLEGISSVWWTSQINCEFETNEIFNDMNVEKKRQMCIDLYQMRTSGDNILPDQNFESITINSHGFRGDDFSETKSINSYRIFMLGGSTMFGTGSTSDDFTIPGYLQTFLDKNEFEFNIEVINAGIQAADSKTELNLISNKLLEFSPDMIIIYDGWNDLRANHDPNQLRENWTKICDLGQENDFETIISLQPISGFGKKSLTVQELEYSKMGTDYSNNLLLDSLPIYDKYEENLSLLESCSLTLNLRDVFDDEIDSIYWDQGHVSDKGNEIVARQLYNNIGPLIMEEKIMIDSFNDSKIENNNKNEYVTENALRDIFSYYKTPLLINSYFSSLNIEFKEMSKQEKDSSADVRPQVIQDYIIDTNSILYDEREINIMIKLDPLKFYESDEKQIEIHAFDKTNDRMIQNTTYFFSIYYNNESILQEYFFAEDGILKIDFHHNEQDMITIHGEKQYAHNAYVMPENSNIRIDGPVFASEGNYEFRFDLRTIDDTDNWVFSLDNFRVKIII